MRALWRAKGLAATVVVTLALDIRDNAAIFSVVRGVLLRPSSIATRDRLIYMRQSRPDIENMTFTRPADGATYRFLPALRVGISAVADRCFAHRAF
jgi:hypothetical protein